MTSDQPGDGAAGNGSTMHERFSWHARNRPAAVAIVDGDRRVGYAELDALADDYAARLEERGVGPGDKVPVLMPRTAEFVAVLLAVLKRGAAYAALDERWPRERLASLVTRLGPPLLVTAAGPWSVPVLAPPAPGSGGGKRPSPVEVDGGSPSTVFFTSGSTGTPKVVLSTHRGALRLLGEDGFRVFGPHSVVPQIAPVPWDGFTLDCWGVLLNGGTSVFPDEPIPTPALLRRLVKEHGVNGALLPTALLNLVVDTDPDALGDLDWVLTGGDRASAAHLRRLLERHPGLDVLNLYGPAECTIAVTARRVLPEDCADPAGVPLGSVLHDTQVYVLDGDRPCATGESGEVCVGGGGLATGYLDDPERTARAFVEVLLDGVPRRLYRTGDLAHWGEDGLLYFDGRNDLQVKVRGHRVEPGELERTVESIAEVACAAAVPLLGASGGYEHLALFYVPRTDATAPDTDELRRELARRLPPYLVPTRIHRVDALPMSANGKVDRQALRERLETRQTGTAAPATVPPPVAEPLADRIAAAIGDLTRVRPVPWDTSFFELGASSLDIARLCTRLGEEERLAVPPSTVFAAPTVRSLAAALEDLRRTAGTGEGAAGPGADGRVTLPLHHAFFLWEDVPEESAVAYLCPMMWWIDGEPDEEALVAALGDVHARHEALRARYTMAPGPTAYVAPDHGSPEVHRPAPRPTDAEAVAEARRELFRPLAISRGRIWRSVLVRSAESGRTLLGAVVHHVAYDGAAESVLADDLGTAYAARRAGVEPVFAGPAASLHQLSAEYERRLAAIDRASQLGYWETQLADLPDVVLPGRQPGEARAGARYTVVVDVPAGQLAPWDRHIRRLGTSRLVFLAAVCAAALRTLTGQDDLGLMVPFSRRLGPPGRTVANRVDMLCLRLRPRPAEDMLDHARSVVAEAMAAQDVPFFEAARGLFAAQRSDTILSTPVLILQDDPEPDLRLPGCTSRFERPDTPTTMTELEIQVRATGTGGLTLTIAAWTDRLPAATAERLAAELGRLLGQCPGPATTTDAGRLREQW
ncbi:AMP-binding protein [Streptomyces sp. NPDC048417]|uniref:AMP-binding protein n=1 Tax=Streptomyces sp. NPDC048417 TaxID=3155387 RepID=UPI00342E2553